MFRSLHSHFLRLTLFILFTCGVSPAADKLSSISAKPTSPDDRFAIGECIVSDDFDQGSDAWKAELEKGGVVEVRNGALEIDVPGGCTVWLKTQLSGPVLISYEATVVSAGGANDRVSDLNCFWMARDARNLDHIFGQARSGKFSDYDQLRCYYVGQGGNSNKTTRFRRYIGEQKNRPLLPEHDLSAKEFLLTPNVSQTIQLVAAGGVIGYYRDGRRIFAYDDPQPYTSGWFAFRTVTNHLRLKNFRVHRLTIREGAKLSAPTANPSAEN
ncbi:MAG: DUF6250 domain-containing protein [Nibricoccus sp.]